MASKRFTEIAAKFGEDLFVIQITELLVDQRVNNLHRLSLLRSQCHHLHVRHLGASDRWLTEDFGHREALIRLADIIDSGANSNGITNVTKTLR